MKIVLVDDHALIREALRSVVVELEDNAVLIETSDGREAMHLITPTLDSSSANRVRHEFSRG